MTTNSIVPSENQYAIRRSTRLPLEIPVLVTSLDAGVPFSEVCNTSLVNAHGCGVIAPRALGLGVLVRMGIVSAKRYARAHVREAVPLGGDPETWLVGLELETPGNFWGIDYAPSDWKIEESTVVEPRSEPEPTVGAKPARSRRWRLSDISAGACYLETAEPFIAGSPVLLSFRVSETECLLEGSVRVSHPGTGMGVEFTGEPAHDRQARVEGLIDQLKNSSDAPKIFVGRKEKTEERQAASHPRLAGTGAEAGAARYDELRDPLLHLIREGPSLTSEQFLNDLRAQRLGKRRDPRIDLVLPVLLTGTDVGGRPLDQRVVTINISRRGAQLDGVHGLLKPGDKVSLARLHHKEQFQVAWVGAADTPAAGQIGVTAIDSNTSFWSEVLETMVQSRIETASIRGNGDGTGD